MIKSGFRNSGPESQDLRYLSGPSEIDPLYLFDYQHNYFFKLLEFFLIENLGQVSRHFALIGRVPNRTVSNH